MSTSSSSSDARALVSFIAESLGRAIERDPSLRSAYAGLQRAGFGLVLRLEAVAGPAPARIVVHSSTASVQEWSDEDRDVLRALGIANERTLELDLPSRQPGRR